MTDTYGIQDLARDMAADVHAHVLAALTPVQKQIAALEKRIAELEQQPRGLKYCGAWAATETYATGDVVTDKGAMWVSTPALTHAKGRPAESRDWTLCVKAGRDGRDLR